MYVIRGLCVVFLALPALAMAQVGGPPVSPATVETVQMPAWLERGGRTQPLEVGKEILNGDRIRTGGQARVYLLTADGSRVKMGENAVLSLYSRSLKPASNFKGALDILTGAFRYTTHAVRGLRSQRDVTIRVGTATAGIRGTDLWGKADAVRDLILLIEGTIEVRHAGVATEMAEPLIYFAAPRNGQAPALTRVDPESFTQWARETEVLPGDGAAQRGGDWKVMLVRVDQQSAALEAYDKARNAGYAAQVRVHAAGTGKPGPGGPWRYEVILAQLASQHDAVVVADKVKSQLGFDAAAGR